MSSCGGGGGGGGGSPKQQALVPGVVALYSFDDQLGNRTLDSSGNGFHGEITGASRVLGKMGEGLLFGRDNAHVLLNNSLPFDKGLITIEAWIKPSKIENGAIYRIIGGYNNHGLYFQIRDGRLEVLYEGQSYHYGNALIQPGVWTHIAFSSDGTDITTYVNGFAEAMTNITLPIQNMLNVNIGASLIYTGGATMTEYVEEFPGIIDELRIWDIVRTADDLLKDCDKQLINPRNLSVQELYWAGLYSFDETSGNIVYDASGLGNDGIITAASRTAGHSGNGLLFGADNARVSFSQPVYFDDGVIYIEAWIKPSKIENGAIYRIIGGYNYHGLYFQIRDGRLEVLYEGQSYHYGNTAIQPGVWTLIAFGSDGKDIATYVNDNDDATTNITLPDRSILNVNIGASEIYTGGATMTEYVEEFPGIIDEVAIVQGVLR
jgi:hypothetical protein